MQMKYNGGLGALLCSKCRIIVSSNFSLLDYKTYSALQESGIDWFCSKCDPEAFVKQGTAFCEEYIKQAKLLENEKHAN